LLALHFAGVDCHDMTFFFLPCRWPTTRKSLAAWLDRVDCAHHMRPALADRVFDLLCTVQATQIQVLRTPRTVSLFSARGAAGVAPAIPSTSGGSEKRPGLLRIVEGTQCAPCDAWKWSEARHRACRTRDPLVPPSIALEEPFWTLSQQTF
jgi:hypothetical protein